MLCGEWYLYGWRWIPVHPHGEIAFYLIRDTGGLQFTILRIFFQFQMLHDEHLHSPVPCHGGGLFYFIMDTDAHRWQTILQRLFTFFFFFLNLPMIFVCIIIIMGGGGPQLHYPPGDNHSPSLWMRVLPS